MSRISEFIEYLESHIGDIYVWGAQGQHDSQITENWIRSRETSSTNAERAIKFWEKRKAEEKRLAAQRQSEFEAQQRLLEQAMKEKKEAEEKQRQEELAAAIQNIVSENFAKITASFFTKYCLTISSLSILFSLL